MSKIEWTEATWNPIVGCSIVSPGCTNCYAMRMAARLEAIGFAESPYAGTTQPSKAGPVWTGKVALATDRALLTPLKRRKPTTYFVNSMGDLFHESVPDAWIDRVFAVMALCPQHTFQVLTKRSARMRAYMNDDELACRIVCTVEQIDALALNDAARFTIESCDEDRGAEGEPAHWPLPNVWLGVSAERQQEADARIPDLLATPAAVRFVSAEPLLGLIDFSSWLGVQQITLQGRPHWTERTGYVSDIDWIIVGGESGPSARPMHPDWARSIRDQCAAAGTAFFFKQWGQWEPALDRDRDDPDWRRDYTNDYVDHGRSKWLNLEGGRGFHGARFHVMRNVGKKAAGRHLDGRLHDDMPQRAMEVA
jgi:protein gp37